MNRFIVLLALLSGAIACVSQPLEPVTAETLPTWPNQPPDAPNHVATSPATPDATQRAAPRVIVEDVEGGDLQLTQTSLVPVQTYIKDKCALYGTGLLRLRIHINDTSSGIEIEPGYALDGSMRRCVLEALSTVQLEDMASRANPSSRPSGFAAQLRVEW